MSKQTSVEWYAGKVHDLEVAKDFGAISVTEYYEKLTKAVQQAKEMEKEQMIEFGELVWKNLLRSDKIMKSRDVYNETYGGNK